MKKSRIVLIIAMSMLVSVNASARFKLGMNFGLQVPVGKFEKRVDAGFGGNIIGEHLLTDNFGFNWSAGYYSLGTKDTDVDGSFSIVPVTVGCRYYFLPEGIKPYVGVEFGAYFFNSDEEYGHSKANLGFAPAVGLQFDLTRNLALNIGLNYNIVSSKQTVSDKEIFPATSTVGANLGIVYAFGTR